MHVHYRFVRHAVALMVVAIVAALIVWPVIFGGFAMRWDAADYFLPMRCLAAWYWQHGRLPLWNPYTQYGFPIVADPQSGAFYFPAALLGWLFGYDFSTLAWEYYLHMVLAGFGFYLLCRWLFGSWSVAVWLGVTYACCGFFISNAQHLSWIIAAAWLPWLGCVVFRLMHAPSWRTAVLVATCFALAFTGSYPAFLIVSAYTIVTVWIWFAVKSRRENRWQNFLQATAWLALAGAVALLYAALPTVAFLHGFPFTDKQAWLNRVYEQGPFPFTAWWSFLLPAAAVMPRYYGITDISMANAYCGIVPLIGLLLLPFALRKKNVALLIGVALLFLLIAVGDALPFREWLFRFVPGMNRFRFPAMFRIYTIVFFLLACGAVFTNHKIMFVLRNRRLVLVTGIAAAIGAAVMSSRVNDPFASFMSLVNPAAFRVPSVLGMEAAAQLTMLAVFCGALLVIRNANRAPMILTTVQIASLLLLVRYNASVTVAGTHNAKPLNKLIASFDTSITSTNKPIGTIAQEGTVDLSPEVYNRNVIEKQVSWNGYNPMLMRAYDQFIHNDTLRNRSFREPLFFWLDSLLTTDSWRVMRFEPGTAAVQCSLVASHELVMQQYAFPGWHCRVNNKEKTIERFGNFLATVRLDPGDSLVEFYFCPSYAWLWWLMLGSGALLAALNAYLLLRMLFGKHQLRLTR